MLIIRFLKSVHFCPYSSGISQSLCSQLFRGRNYAHIVHAKLGFVIYQLLMVYHFIHSKQRQLFSGKSFHSNLTINSNSLVKSSISPEKHSRKWVCFQNSFIIKQKFGAKVIINRLIVLSESGQRQLDRGTKIDLISNRIALYPQSNQRSPRA